MLDPQTIARLFIEGIRGGFQATHVGQRRRLGHSVRVEYRHAQRIVGFHKRARDRRAAHEERSERAQVTRPRTRLIEHAHPTVGTPAASVTRSL